VAWLDDGGALRVGPRSAGAVPGPACYGTGGDQPTVTDASLVLGYLDPDYFAGGTMPLSRSLAEEAIQRAIAGPLGMEVLVAAHGIHTIVNSNMVDEIRLVSVFRGYDPRNFSLVAMGGAGPVHAGRLAQQTNIGRVLVPRSPGVQSAFGLLVANLEHERAKTHRVEAVKADPAELAVAFGELESSCGQQMERDRLEDTEITVRRSVEMRYIGQSYELDLPFPEGPVDAHALSAVLEDFHSLHERVYGHRDADHLVEFITLRVTLSQTPPRPWTPPDAPLGDPDPAPAQKGVRPAYFGEAAGRVETPIYSRDALAPGMELAGPAIVEQEDSTTVIYPGHRVSVDRYGNILIQVPIGESSAQGQ
ncbi:MAG: hydantoinase/oxoprolinase family protein, partial [Dehalococcoidia bacterium]